MARMQLMELGFDRLDIRIVTLKIQHRLTQKKIARRVQRDQSTVSRRLETIFTRFPTLRPTQSQRRQRVNMEPDDLIASMN